MDDERQEHVERILHEIDERTERMEHKMATLADEITRLQADDVLIQADVVAVQTALTTNTATIASLQAVIAAGGLTAEQEAALTQVATDFETANTSLTAALTPAPAPPGP